MCSACHEKFTYTCQNCSNSFSSRFSMMEVICRVCGEYMKSELDDGARIDKGTLKSNGVER